MDCCKTDVLEIAYEVGGPTDGPAVLMLHGWPDDATTWRPIAARLQRAGYRTVAPWLRGFGATRFLDAATPRDGRAAAIATDALDLMDHLRIERFHVVGHDWGARVAYSLSTLAPERMASATALSVAYAPHAAFEITDVDQARRWWYQFFMSTDEGLRRISADPIGFARVQWDTWSPQGWFDPDTFTQVAASFDNPDWLRVTFSGYRSRWMSGAEADARYGPTQARLEAAGMLAVPTLLIQGGADACDPPSDSEALERWFSAGYDRVVLDGVGHFPAREAPDDVLRLLLDHIKTST